MNSPSTINFDLPGFNFSSFETEEADTLPSYSVRKNVPKTYKPKRGIFNGLYSVLDNMGRAEAVIMTGREKVKGKKVDMRLGNKTFFYNGTCEPDSLDGCDGEPRAIILDNTSSKGLIPGMAKDIINALNPQNIMDAFDGKGKFGKKCKRIDFKEIQLIPKKDPIEKEHSICVPEETIEGFQTFQTFNQDKKKEKCVCILILIILVILFIVRYQSLLH
tara:strand:- start:255 stop:908 length:654 start_codon:yes stop_codon:yes gene_type:complete